MAAGGNSIWTLLTQGCGNGETCVGPLLQLDATSGHVLGSIHLDAGGIWIAADPTGVWLSSGGYPDPSTEPQATFIDAATDQPSGPPGDVYNFRPFAVADGRVWFVSGPGDPGLPKGGICGLNVVTRLVDTCGRPDSIADLEGAHDPAAFEPMTSSIWVGEYESPWVTRIDVTPASSNRGANRCACGGVRVRSRLRVHTVGRTQGRARRSSRPTGGRWRRVGGTDRR